MEEIETLARQLLVAMVTTRDPRLDPGFALPAVTEAFDIAETFVRERLRRHGR